MNIVYKYQQIGTMAFLRTVSDWYGVSQEIFGELFNLVRTNGKCVHPDRPNGVLPQKIGIMCCCPILVILDNSRTGPTIGQQTKYYSSDTDMFGFKKKVSNLSLPFFPLSMIFFFFFLFLSSSAELLFHLSCGISYYKINQKQKISSPPSSVLWASPLLEFGSALTQTQFVFLLYFLQKEKKDKKHDKKGGNRAKKQRNQNMNKTILPIAAAA